MQVRLGKAHVKREGASGRLVIEIELEASGARSGEPAPNREWTEWFNRYRDYPGDLEEPDIRTGSLEVEVRDEDIDRLWEALSDRINATNAAYASEVTPRLEAEERARQAANEASQKRMKKAQDVLDKLTGESSGNRAWRAEEKSESPGSIADKEF